MCIRDRGQCGDVGRVCCGQGVGERWNRCYLVVLAVVTQVCQYRALTSSQRLSGMVGVGTRGRYEPLLLTLGQSASEHPCDAEAIKDARTPSRRHRRPDHPSIDGIKLALYGDGSQQGEGRA